MAGRMRFPFEVSFFMVLVTVIEQENTNNKVADRISTAA